MVMDHCDGYCNMIRVHTSVNLVWSFTIIKRYSILIMYICGINASSDVNMLEIHRIFFRLWFYATINTKKLHIDCESENNRLIMIYK